jgi:hypothetical protein
VQNLLIRQAGHALGARLASFGRASTGTPNRCAREVCLAVKIIQDAFPRFFDCPLLSRRGIDWDAHKHIAVPSMTCFVPGLAVGLQIHPQLWDIHAAQPDKNRQSFLPDPRKSLLCRRCHADGRVGLLIGPWRDDGILEVVILALIAEAFPFPGFEDDLQGLLEARLAFRIVDAVEIVGPWGAAAPNAEIEAPFADVVDCSSFFGDPQRIIQGQHLDRCAHP